MAYTFHGGTHPDDKKAATNKKAIEPMRAPEKVVLPVSMHIGAPAKPVVAKGDYVYMGQLIAEATGNVSANVHATISGTVLDVAPHPHPNGTNVLSIIIENDYKDAPDPSLHPLDADTMTPEQMTEAIREAGIVGHGGATFPTHVKIQSAIGKVDTLIINGAECEPYITSDHRILLEQTQDVLDGIKILIKVLGVHDGKLAVEENKADVFPVIEKLLPQDNSIQLCKMKTKYPQGAEKQLIQAITGREVPSAKLPADAGCAVFNVDTVATIARKFKTGMNDVRRIVTVSGSAIASPKNLEVRIGTPIGEVIEAAGGFKEDPNKILMGGPMMGTAVADPAFPVLKQNNALVAFGPAVAALPAPGPCIRCGNCINACPMGLSPVEIAGAYTKNDGEMLDKLMVDLCIGCGTCSYVCPAKRPVTQTMNLAKAVWQKNKNGGKK